MNFREAHKIWIAQCEAAETVRARFGLRAAFNYIVGEKLIILSKRRPISCLCARAAAIYFPK
jgi:hypothetical protein